MTDVLGLLKAFAESEEARLILGLILVDFLSGLAAALRTKSFQWKETADFLATNVLPYLIGYMGMWVVVELGLLGDSPILQMVAQYFGAAAVVATLTASIAENLKELGQPPPPVDPEEE